MLNVSHRGALLRFDDAPDVFMLSLTENGHPQRPCRVIWRGGSDVGVEFDPGIKTPEKSVVELE